MMDGEVAIHNHVSRRVLQKCNFAAIEERDAAHIVRLSNKPVSRIA